jgi:hypothetical protein
MARLNDTDQGMDGKDGKDVAGHRKFSEPDENDELAPIGGAAPRPRLDPDEDDTEGHLFTGGPSTKGEVLPRVPADNPHGD